MNFHSTIATFPAPTGLAGTTFSVGRGNATDTTAPGAVVWATDNMAGGRATYAVAWFANPTAAVVHAARLAGHDVASPGNGVTPGHDPITDPRPYVAPYAVDWAAYAVAADPTTRAMSIIARAERAGMSIHDFVMARDAHRAAVATPDTDDDDDTDDDEDDATTEWLRG